MLVFGCAIFISTIAQSGPPGYLRSNHHFPPGRLTIDRVANFGWNLGFSLQIDGANSTRGPSDCGARRVVVSSSRAAAGGFAPKAPLQAAVGKGGSARKGP